METCDVLIVGGGPAGSSCARLLRQAGADVLVLDKRRFPRQKPCAGWITPQVVQTLKLDLVEYSRDHVCQPITGFCCGMIGSRSAQVRYGETISYGIRRYEFDAYLLALSGARCVFDQPVRSLERDGSQWTVNGRYRASMLVGAGGNFCPVARLLGARVNPQASVVAAQEVEFEVAEEDLARGRVDAEMPELYFCQDLKGYAWCFRKENFLNIGLGRLDNRQLSAQVAQFASFLRDSGKVACEIPPQFAGHAYQLYERIVPRLVDDGVILIGDAAGLAYPESGEGIRPAVESGVMAAEVIVKAAGDYAEGSLAPYAAAIERRFGPPRQKGLTGWLPQSWLRLLAGQLLASGWFARRVVMDQWFLHRSVPAYVA
jgi:geranylgeranyl reductase family protein